jgi:hypothetical protein
MAKGIRIYTSLIIPRCKGKMIFYNGSTNLNKLTPPIIATSSSCCLHSMP